MSRNPPKKPKKWTLIGGNQHYFGVNGIFVAKKCIFRTNWRIFSDFVVKKNDRKTAFKKTKCQKNNAKNLKRQGVPRRGAIPPALWRWPKPFWSKDLNQQPSASPEICGIWPKKQYMREICGICGKYASAYFPPCNYTPPVSSYRWGISSSEYTTVTQNMRKICGICAKICGICGIWPKRRNMREICGICEKYAIAYSPHRRSTHLPLQSWLIST